MCAHILWGCLFCQNNNLRIDVYACKGWFFFFSPFEIGARLVKEIFLFKNINRERERRGEGGARAACRPARAPPQKKIKKKIKKKKIKKKN